MPKKPIDYSKALIYKLCCNDLSVKDIYVGHTTDFTQRKRSHKSDCNNENGKSYDCKKYRMIRENGGWFNWSMIEIEKYPCSDVNEAEARERYWYETLDPNLNSICPQRNKQQYYQDNKQKIAEQAKQYRELNKEKLVEYDKQKYLKNKEVIKAKKATTFVCECGSCSTIVHKNRHLKSQKHQQYLASLPQNELTNL